MLQWFKSFWTSPKGINEYLTQDAEIVIKDYSVPEPTSEPVVVLSEFEKAKAKFNVNTDILVISQGKVKELAIEDKIWLAAQGDKIFYFVEDSLINIAVVRAGGFGW